MHPPRLAHSRGLYRAGSLLSVGEQTLARPSRTSALWFDESRPPGGALEIGKWKPDGQDLGLAVSHRTEVFQVDKMTTSKHLF